MTKSLLLAAFLSFSCFAEFVAEPSFGYTLSGKDSTDSTNTYTAPELGASIAYKEAGFKGGLKYNHHFYTFKDSSKNTTVSNVDGNDLGLTVGYQHTIGFRAWFSYYFLSKISYPATYLNAVASGSTIELGLGYLVIPNLSINLNYRHYKHSSFSIQGQSTNGKSGDGLDEFVLGISAPIQF